MTTLTKGTFSLNLGIIRLTGELGKEDRQCAWEIYTEIVTRVAVMGKSGNPDCADFSGEIYIESLTSLHKFFLEARAIMRKFPVGKIDQDNHKHLGIMISNAISQVLRPFLEKWQVRYRHWWESESDPKLPPMERQRAFPELDNFLHDWKSVRWLMRKLQGELIKVYSLVDVSPAPNGESYMSESI